MKILMFLPIVQATMLVVVSFFVLVVASKVESKNLKEFGKLLAIALWAIAASIIILTVYSSMVGYRCPGKMMGERPMHSRMMR